VRDDLIEALACPECRGALAVEGERTEGEEVWEGTLRCERCDRRYPVRRGVPRLNRSMEGLEEIAASFTHEWKAHHAGELEEDTVFGRSPEEDWRHFVDGTGVSVEQLRGKRVLDAGCGSGRLTRQIAERGAGFVVGSDINEAVDDVFELACDIPTMHVVQANIFALPFREGSFDVVWCCGVIHHTPDPERAFRALARQVKPGGVLYLWVYPRRFNPFRATKDVLERVGLRRLAPPDVLRLAKAISYPSLVLHRLYRLLRAIPGLEPRGEWGRRTVKLRTLAELQMSWNDALTPRYDSRHSEDEVRGWFEAAGFSDLAVLGEPRLGMRGVAPGSAAAEQRRPVREPQAMPRA
jgi:2-polyprenyl-3-methyl-5-hydroxy-6-metoxy-1,4-benzoquinol methylase